MAAGVVVGAVVAAGEAVAVTPANQTCSHQPYIQPATLTPQQSSLQQQDIAATCSCIRCSHCFCSTCKADEARNGCKCTGGGGLVNEYDAAAWDGLGDQEDRSGMQYLEMQWQQGWEQRWDWG